MVVDDLDDLIEQEKIKEEPPAGDPPAGDPPPPASEPPVTKTEGAPAVKEEPTPAVKVPTPKEILGLDETATWDGIKTTLSEVIDLRQKVQLAESLPKTAFVNDKVAGFNEFLKNNPKVAEAPNAYSIFESVLTVAPEDPLKVLTTGFILNNPKFAGKDDVVSNMLLEKYGLNNENVPQTDFQKVQMETDAEEAFKGIAGLRESFKSPSAPEPVDVAAREAQWKTSIETELSGFTKLPVPITNAESGKPELYLEFEIPKDWMDRFTEDAVKAYSKTGPVTEQVVKQIKSESIKEFLFTNFQNITHAIKTKAVTKERLAVETEYDGAGILKTEHKEASTGAQTPDVYDTAFGSL